MFAMGQNPIRSVGPALVGGGVFLLFLWITGNPVLAILLALGAYVAGLFLFLPSKEVTITVGGIGSSDLRQVLEEHGAKATYIRELAQRIFKDRVRDEVLRLHKFYREILSDIAKDPKDLKTARAFLNYYPDAVIKILERYTDLQRRPVSDPSIATSVEKVEGMLQQITRAFEKQLAQLLQDDVMDLDTEMELLRRTMQSEGLSD